MIHIYIPFNTGEEVTCHKESEWVMQSHEFFSWSHWNIYVNVLVSHALVLT